MLTALVKPTRMICGFGNRRCHPLPPSGYAETQTHREHSGLPVLHPATYVGYDRASVPPVAKMRGHTLSTDGTRSAVERTKTRSEIGGNLNPSHTLGSAPRRSTSKATRNDADNDSYDGDTKRPIGYGMAGAPVGRGDIVETVGRKPEIFWRRCGDRIALQLEVKSLLKFLSPGIEAQDNQVYVLRQNLISVFIYIAYFAADDAMFGLVFW
jgi:hypothetical protein